MPGMYIPTQLPLLILYLTLLFPFSLELSCSSSSPCVFFPPASTPTNATPSTNPYLKPIHPRSNPPTKPKSNPPTQRYPPSALPPRSAPLAHLQHEPGLRNKPIRHVRRHPGPLLNLSPHHHHQYYRRRRSHARPRRQSRAPLPPARSARRRRHAHPHNATAPRRPARPRPRGLPGVARERQRRGAHAGASGADDDGASPRRRGGRGGGHGDVDDADSFVGRQVKGTRDGFVCGVECARGEGGDGGGQGEGGTGCGGGYGEGCAELEGGGVGSFWVRGWIYWDVEAGESRRGGLVLMKGWQGSGGMGGSWISLRR